MIFNVGVINIIYYISSKEFSKTWSWIKYIMYQLCKLWQYQRSFLECHIQSKYTFSLNSKAIQISYFSILWKSWHKCPFKEIQIWLLSLKRRRRGKKNRSSEVKFTVSQKNNWEIKSVLCMWMLKPSVNEGLGFYHILHAKWCNKVYERKNQSSTTIILL